MNECICVCHVTSDEHRGSGGYNGPDTMKNIALLFHEDCVMDWASEVEMHNTDMNKLYHGHLGMAEFTRRLTEIDFIDFKPVITNMDDEKALVKVTFTPKNHASGKKADTMIAELHEWSVVDGKVKTVKVAPVQPSIMDSTFLTAEEAVGRVMKVFELWGTGAFNNAKKGAAAFKQHFNDDVVFDCSADMKNTDGYTVYTGEAEFFKWINFLSGIDFPDFTVRGCTPLNDSVIISVSYTPTVKSTGKTGPLITDIFAWKFAGGKIASTKHFWGNPAALDACFAASE